MNLELPIVVYLVVGIYLLLMLGIGFYFSRYMKDSKSYFIGANIIPWWVGGLSLYMTMFSAWTFTGAASFTYNTGWYGILYFATWPLTFFFGFQLSARKWRRTRITTPVEYVHTRFNKTTHLFFAIIFTVTMIYWPAHHLASLSKICAPTLFPNSMAAIDIMIIVVGAVILLYTFSGGFWAVCITDVVQFLILISICLVLIPTAFLSTEIGSVTEFLHRIPPLTLTHWTAGDMRYDIWFLLGVPAAYIFSYMTGSNAQRYFSVKDETAAKRVGWLTFGLLCLGPAIFGLPPLIGKVLWPDINMLSYFANITKADENIYIAVVMRFLPAGMVGVFISAMMAASMSSMSASWNTLSAIVSLDIYKKLFKPNASERELLIVGKVTVVFFSLTAIGLALAIIHSKYGVFSITNIVFGLTGVPIAIPLLMGILYRKMSRWSAIASIVAGILTSSVAKFALHFPLGPQYLITVTITLLFIFLSYPQGWLYLHKRRYAYTLNLFLGLLFWLFFLSLSQNPNLSLMKIDKMIGHGFFAIISSAFFWVTISAGSLTGLAHFFTRLYARDQQSDQQEVEQFFQKLMLPVDVEKEVLTPGVKELNIFPLVGTISVFIALVSLGLLLSSDARMQIGVTLIFSGMLLIIGILMILSKNIQKMRNS